jgi:hypothetical protein
MFAWTDANVRNIPCSTVDAIDCIFKLYFDAGSAAAYSVGCGVDATFSESLGVSRLVITSY